MLKAVALFCCLLTVTACDKLQDPVSAAIFSAPNYVAVDVKRSLPASADEALRVLANWGYLPNGELEMRASTTQASAEDGRSVADMYFLPEVARLESARDRKYLMRAFKAEYRSEGYGLIFDVGANGEVATAVGFVSYQFIL